MMLAVLVGLLAVAIWVVRKRYFSHRLPLPPGPRPLPIIGNLLDMPVYKPWEKYREWCIQYNSDIIFLHLPLQPTVVLGSTEAAFELLEKRSHIYSDRFPSLVPEMLGWGFHFAFHEYGAKWRTNRRNFHQYFNEKAALQHRGSQLEYSRRFLTWVLETPEDTYKNLRRFSVAVIFRVVYGVDITGMDDLYVRLAEKAVTALIEPIIPGAQWAEFFPFLHKIPGTSSRRIQDEFRHAVDEMLDQPYGAIKQAVSDGTAVPSIVHSMISSIQNHSHHMTPDESKEAEEMARNIGGVAYAGASDTTLSAMESFLLAMALFPDVQKKAQEELDRVVGPNRLPEYEDLESLVYIRAAAMEAMRWIPVAPFGIPHRLMEDDVYNGYFIPKGTVIIPNTGYLLHNPEHYPEPERFNPDRFIGPDGQINPSVLDPTTLAFGFGRRECPGRYFSSNTLSIFIASVLHVFDITPGFDANGDPMKLSSEWKSGILSGPVDFPRGFKPRSAQAERLVREVMVAE